MEGDVVFFSANGTTDSSYDAENLLYNWDMDTSVDSDGDGNPLMISISRGSGSSGHSRVLAVELIV